MTAAPRILQLRLDGLAQTMQQTLLETAVSPAAREGADCACALFTAEGELLAMSEAIPLLLGALPGIVTAVLGTHPAHEMRDGQLFVANDPFAGGTHLPDIAVIAPIFFGDRLIAFAASVLHHQDVGGARAGSVPPDARDIYQEGLRLPPMRAGSNHCLEPDLLRLVRANSRVPDIVIADLEAQVAASRSAARGVRTIASDMGAEAFVSATTALLDAAERATSACLAALPTPAADGVDGLDPVPEMGPCEVRVTLRVGDGVLTADFTGSSPQVPAPVNCVASGPLSALLYAVLTLLGAGAFRNGGMLRCIELVLPDASIVNAKPPAPVNARTNMVRAITSAILQALGEISPDAVPAANSGMSYVIAFSGRDAAQRTFLSTEIVAGGAGGGPAAPGAAGLSTDVGNARNNPAETLEATVPVRLVAAERRTGSGGPGRFPGGDGVRRVYEALADGVAASVRGERFVRVPAGAHGGGPPQGSAARIVRADGTVEDLTARSAVTLDMGDRLIVESCGGAGYGARD